MRRPAGYEIIDTRENTRRQVAIPLVDTIRDRVRQWRADGWPGTTAVTLALLQHWWDADKVSRRQYPFYFCQLEAIETLIWHLEACLNIGRASSSRATAARLNGCATRWPRAAARLR